MMSRESFPMCPPSEWRSITGISLTLHLCSALAAPRCAMLSPLLRPGLRHARPHQRQAGDGDSGEAEEGGGAAQVVADVAGERRAQRGADAHRHADEAKRQVEAPGAARDVGPPAAP